MDYGHLPSKFWSLKALHHRSVARDRPNDLWFTSGCFDLFHLGHLNFLMEAGRKASEDHCFLVVAVNSDSSVENFKQKTPILDLHTRKLLVANVDKVKFILEFDDPNPTELIERLEPRVVVHGHSEHLPAFTKSDELQNYSGRVEKLTLLGEWSTTNLIKKILARNSGEN